MIRNKIRIAATVIAFSLALGAATRSHAAEPYDVNVILPLTGGGAYTGKSGQDTLKVLQALVNANGGIQGRPLRFVFHDSGTSPQNAVSIFQEIAATGVPLVLGPEITGECAAVEPLIPNGPVSWCFSPGMHPKAGSYMFGSFASTTDLLETLIRFLRLKGWTHIATITTTDASGQDAMRSIDEVLKLPENADVKLVEQQSASPTDVSVMAQIARIKAAEPQVIIGWAIGSPEATILRSIRDAGLTQPVVIGQGNASYVFMEQFASFLPQELYLPENLGTIRSGLINLPPAVLRARKTYFAALDAAGLKAEVGGEAVWDGAMTVIDALRHLGPTPTAQQIRDYIQNLKDFPGISGVADFSKHVQRGYGRDETAVARWNPQTRLFEAASAPGGKPLP